MTRYRHLSLRRLGIVTSVILHKKSVYIVSNPGPCHPRPYVLPIFGTDGKLKPIGQSLVEERIGLPSLPRWWGKIDSAVAPDLGPEAFDLPIGEVVRARIVAIIHVVFDSCEQNR